MPETTIHRTAEISPGAVIGEGVRIGPYSVIGDGAVVGDGTVIEAFVRLTSYVTVGRNCHIFDGVILGQPPQDHDFGGETSYVTIGDDVVLREGVTIHRATGEGLATSVGRGSMLMEGCHLGHNVRVGECCTLTNKAGLSGHVQMGDYVVVGGLAGFHQFVRVGSYAMVGGLAKIVMDVPPYSLVDGNPASMYGLNTVGLRRHGFSQAQRSRIKNIYRTLFETAANLEDGLASIGERYAGDAFAGKIAAFVGNSRRGVYHWHQGTAEHRGRKK
ncbi:MAG: acyl-ACP--UDP-N-acetylglucosamine O-acyltransferase [Synergistaceae bacterium]|jgi:UDP-N-acetylglucosamine acyltransferase|nr:acyl-ACP--UDP-N-acetylglucosamine O-acyltransferase [Synergistaceae bacterium]